MLLKIVKVCFKISKYFGWFRLNCYFFALHTKLFEKKWRKLYPHSELLESFSKISRLAIELGKLQ